MLNSLLSKSAISAITCSLILASTLAPVSIAQEKPLFDGCPSEQILERFVDFGRTGKMPPDLGRWLNTPEAQYIEPWKPFDNVDFVGICWVSAWLVHTDEGTVLIDTLYGPFQKTIAENIKKTGTDFADIKYVLMTHGHFDHAGGAAALKPLLPNAKFAMTQKGWDEAVKSSIASQGGRRAWKIIKPDMTVKDGDEIRLGDNTFTVLETPGHTWGTASYLYSVQDGENTHRAITIGGLGLNAIDGPAQVEAYINSVDRLGAQVTEATRGVEVHLTTHGFSNKLDENRQALAARSSDAANVFVNPEGILKQIAALRGRAVKRLDKEKSQ